MEILKTDVLLIIDVQNDFIPGGALAVEDGDQIVPIINKLSDHFAAAGAGVVLTQDWHPKGHTSFASTAGVEAFAQNSETGDTYWPDHCVQGTKGAEFVKGLNTNPAFAIIRKGMDPKVDSYSAFQDNDKKVGTGLDKILREKGYHRVFCVGLAYDYCVAFTALDAIGLRFDTFVIEDATRAIAANTTEVANQNFQRRGVNRINAEAVLNG